MQLISIINFFLFMEIPDIKQHLTLSQVLQYYGLKPDKNGRLNCPFHDDKTPSLQVYYKTHTVYCFSSNCKTHGKSMDVIDFVMHKESLDKHEALLKCVEIIEYYQGKINHQHKPVQTNPTAALTIPREQFLQNMFTYFKMQYTTASRHRIISGKEAWILCGWRLVTIRRSSITARGAMKHFARAGVPV